MAVRKTLGLAVGVFVLTAACGIGSSPQLSDTTLGPGEATDEYRVPEYDELIELALADIQYYWGETFPDLYGERYQPIPASRIHAGSPDNPPPACGGGPPAYENVEGNAFYCTLGDFVAWDDRELFPELYDKGPYAVALVLAHEWGHVIQGRAGLLEPDTGIPTIVTELQADCFAGAWTLRLAEGEADRLQLSTTAFEEALSGMLDFGDQPGADPLDPSAHGSGFDRVNAFQEGFEEGSQRCAEYTDVDSAGEFAKLPLITEFPFTDEKEILQGGNLSLPVIVRDLTAELNTYFSANFVGFEEIVAVVGYDSANGETPDCGGVYEPADTEFVVFYCAADGTVYHDQQLFRLLSRQVGDYGVGVLLAMEWARAAQHAAGYDFEDELTVQQRGCLAGAFSWEMLDRDRDPETANPDHLLFLSPGDLDEAIRSFLRFPPTDADMEQVSDVFSLVAAFRDGVFNQEEACVAYG
jgi:predicted metalloprotease